MALIVIFLVIVVVYIVNNRRKREIDSITKVALAAINNGDADTAKKYMHMLERDRSIKDKLMRRVRSGVIWGVIALTVLMRYLIHIVNGTLEDHLLLLVSGVLIAYAAGNLVYGLAGRRMYAAEIEAEERKNLDMMV